MNPLLFVIFALLLIIAGLFILLMAVADRLDARRRMPVTFGDAAPLPLALARPAKWRNDLAARNAANNNQGNE